MQLDRDNNKNTMLKQDTDDYLRVFLLWVNDICQFYGITEYRLLKEANMRCNFFADIRLQLNGKKKRRSNVSLYFLIHINLLYPYPLDLSKYLSMLVASPNTTESKTIERVFSKQVSNKKAANKLILTASV